MSPWFKRTAPPAVTTGRIGPLERRVLDALWEAAAPASVRALQPAFPDIAYTTLMTTLDRLHRKGLLARTRAGRAFLYRPLLSRGEFESARAVHAVRAALAEHELALGPFLSYFVEAVSDRDHELLDELEALVRARRASLGDRRS